MSEPAWAAPTRQFVPLHLTPGSTRSSFARPDDYKLPQSNPSKVGSSPPQRQRSNFASRPKSKSKRSGQLDTPEDELPPTQSICGNYKYSFGEPGSESPGLQTALPTNVANISKVNISSSKNANSPSNSKSGFSVNIYGFPPGSTSTVLQHFGKFGEIVENVDEPGTSTAAVECGRNWIRITYKDRQSAAAALAQDGAVMPGQYMIGCQLAEPAEFGGVTHQSSTNSLLLDDSDVSVLQDQTLASILHEDSNIKEGNSSISRSGSISSKTNGSTKGRGSFKANANEKDRGDYSIGQIVPLEMTEQLFRQPTPAQPRPADENITKVADAAGSQGVFGKVINKLTDSLFGWDL